MPKKKTEQELPFNIQKLMDGSDSYKSLIYGIVTVVVLFIVIALGINTLSKNKAQIDENAAVTEQNNSLEGSKYVVMEGETLWSIADKFYKDGFKWNEIAKANNISDPSNLEKGDRLVIPSVQPQQKIAAVSPTVVAQPSPTVTVMPTAVVTKAPAPSAAPTTAMTTTGKKITDTKYTVAKGDYLWDIAVRAYGDGYKWVEIARANKLANPDLIFSGNVLQLPR